MSWRTFNDSQVLTESWTKITTHSHIQNSIDLLTEDIRKGQSELHTIEEGTVGRAGTWLKNRVKGYGNMAKNIGKNIGNVAHGGATEGGINVRGQFDLDQLQSVWKNFHTDVFKMLPKEKMVAEYPEINKAIDDLANAIAGLNVGAGAGATPPAGEAPTPPEGIEIPPEGGEVPPGEDTGGDGYNMPGGYRVGGPDGEPPGGAVDVPPQTLPGSDTPPEEAPPEEGDLTATAKTGDVVVVRTTNNPQGQRGKVLTGPDGAERKNGKILIGTDGNPAGYAYNVGNVEANPRVSNVNASYNPLTAKIGFMGDWGVL